MPKSKTEKLIESMVSGRNCNMASYNQNREDFLKFIIEPLGIDSVDSDTMNQMLKRMSKVEVGLVACLTNEMKV